MANILIVDDEETDRVIEKTILEDAGHRVHFARDGQAALDVYADSPADVVVTDLKMPRLNGLRLIQQQGHGPECGGARRFRCVGRSARPCDGDGRSTDPPQASRTL